MRATDLDESLKVKISYTFAAQSTHIQFGFDHHSGGINTLSTLDYEEIKKYSMVSEARRRGELVVHCS